MPDDAYFYIYFIFLLFSSFIFNAEAFLFQDSLSLVLFLYFRERTEESIEEIADGFDWGILQVAETLAQILAHCAARGMYESR